MMDDLYALDDIANLRMVVYHHIADTGQVPTIREMATLYNVNNETMQRHFEHLEVHHAAFLHPETREILMAHPFSASPTPFRVIGENVSWWANCAWDAIAIPATLGINAQVEMTCGDCSQTISMTVNQESAPLGEGLVHFYVPAGKWYKDVGFT